MITQDLNHRYLENHFINFIMKIGFLVRMKRRFCLSILIIGAGLNLCAQTLEGIVVDSKSKLPIQYAHIGISGKNAGTVSKETGEFSLNLSEYLSADTIVFSSIGYETLYLSDRSLQSQSGVVIELDPVVYQIAPIEIVGNRLDAFILGRTKNTKTTTGHTGNSNYGVGAEWGLKIKYPESPYYLKEVKFHARYNTVDSVLFRVNVYHIDESGLPGRSLTKKPVFTKSYRKDKWISTNLLDRALLIEEDIIVTFETLRIWYRNKGKNWLFFSHGEGYEIGTTYSRASSHDHWQINQAGPIALYIKGIYKE